MMTTSTAVGLTGSACRGGEAVGQRREFAWMARAGLVARGVSYAIIGILALRLAVGAGGETTNQRGALTTIAEQSFGKALLIAMTIGLASYAIWRLVRAGIGHGTQDDGATLSAARLVQVGEIQPVAAAHVSAWHMTRSQIGSLASL